ncbi:unnamed protein product [Danaus chrysippus]|uniref:(African queen) hypothetical protein n=1 Tax=Danaus chrysippus TaxID=151541 RepID=A0A8J2QQR7_9NEOP|nr:unnamed protein product [Danaus chrysippus]
MKLIFLLLTIGLTGSEASNCCKHGVVEDAGNFCVDVLTNQTSPTNLTCPHVDTLSLILFNYTVSEDSLILTLNEDLVVELERDNFCVSNGTRFSDDPVAVICSEVEEKILEESVYGYCMIVSVVFLVITVIVYSILPKLRDLLGKSIINFCASLAIGLSTLAIMNIMEYSDLKWCAVRGFLAYFFILATFFWSNSISIQILRSLDRPTSIDYSWKSFLWYALYAWGCPTILTVILAIVNFTPGRHRKPGIGLNTCWFFDHKQQWYYMYSVMTILIVSNMVIFMYISLSLWRHTFASTHIKALKYKFWMTVRMFIVMGLAWIFEMISSLSKPHIIWVILDFFNLLQGLLLFLVLVVFRKRVIKELYNKGWLECVAGCVERHLAVGDDEEDVVEHTIGVALEEK